MRHTATHGQLVLELRVDFAGAARAELELDGVVHRASAVIDGEGTSEWRAVAFGGKYLELRVIHEGVPRLINAVYEGEGFMAQVMTYAKSFVPPARASKAVGLIKRAVISGGEMSFAEGLAYERELQQQLFTSADATEGLAAYGEKRRPVFKGG